MTFSETVKSAIEAFETSEKLQVVFLFVESGNLEEPIYSYCPMDVFENETDLTYKLNISDISEILPIGEVDDSGFDCYSVEES